MTTLVLVNYEMWLLFSLAPEIQFVFDFKNCDRFYTVFGGMSEKVFLD